MQLIKYVCVAFLALFVNLISRHFLSLLLHKLFKQCDYRLYLRAFCEFRLVRKVYLFSQY